jgi:hypothetical protein
MAIERPPDADVGNREALKSYRPPQNEVARYYTTKTGRQETLQTVASANSITVKELLAFNFPGTVVNDQIVPPVVNWYLHHHVEFDCPETHDHKNRVFQGNEKLAIPLHTTYIEFHEPLVITAQAPAAPGVWFGGGYKGGTTFGVVGIETTQIVCVSADGKTGFTATISGTRFPALGVGASGGPILVFITSMHSPGQLSNLLSGGKDFSLAVGAKLESLLGGARYGKAVNALAKFAAKYGKSGARGLKAGKALVKYNSQITDIVKLLGMKLNHYEPEVFSLGSPWGGFGVEVSIHFTVSKFQVESIVNL